MNDVLLIIAGLAGLLTVFTVAAVLLERPIERLLGWEDDRDSRRRNDGR